MYRFADPVQRVRGLGPHSVQQLAARGISTIGELLTLLPLRYEDRTQLLTVDHLAALTEKQVVTLTGTLSKARTQYRGRASIQRAVFTDSTGNINIIWFNSPYIVKQLDETATYMVSGTYDPKYRTLGQPTIEKASFDTIHTNRLVPIYSSTVPLKVGMHRRIMKHIVDSLAEERSDLQAQSGADVTATPVATNSTLAALPSLAQALAQLHFPTTEDSVVAARERLALEECLALMQHSKELRARWQLMRTTAIVDAATLHAPEQLIPHTIPFPLTAAQRRCVQEILTDLSTTTPMNRLLIGDVGAGKTVVAAVAAYHAVKNGHRVALVAPTKILAEQHARSLASLFPDLPISLVVGGRAAKGSTASQSPAHASSHSAAAAPMLFIGTHAVFHQLEALQPALIIYDEQQRFGVLQRSLSGSLAQQPHVLTMTATPIPRSLTLTLFAHLHVSHLDELPAGRLPVKTWLVPSAKREASYQWVAEQIDAEQSQVFVVCPFIDPSSSQALENVASVTEMFEQIKAAFPRYRVGLLHARLNKTQQAQVIHSVYEHELDILVTTPIVEVGVDLPEAAIMIVENAERFGLSSLHQLRGRVGRAGQQGYCLLFTHAHQAASKERLKQFSNESKGLKIAEIDLQNRGAGELFGTTQTGFSELRFGSWTNLELITTARQTFDQLPQDWRSPLFGRLDDLGSGTTESSKPAKHVLAN